MTDEKRPVAANDGISGSKWLGKGPVWIMILIVGPLAIPFLLLSPHFSRKAKIGLSVALLLVTFLFYRMIPIIREQAALLGVSL